MLFLRARQVEKLFIHGVVLLGCVRTSQYSEDQPRRTTLFKSGQNGASLRNGSVAAEKTGGPPELLSEVALERYRWRSPTMAVSIFEFVKVTLPNVLRHDPYLLYALFLRSRNPNAARSASGSSSRQWDQGIFSAVKSSNLFVPSLLITKWYEQFRSGAFFSLSARNVCLMTQ